MTTTAEKLKAEGRREGFVQGQQEGLMQAHQALVRALLKQMRAKFPELSVDVERKVEMASIAQLELWLERILTAQRPEDVVTDS